MANKRPASAAPAAAAKNDEAAADALYVLARRYEQHGYYLHAIKALKAICSLDLLPAVAARYTLHLAGLLMERTESKDEARRILETAVGGGCGASRMRSKPWLDWSTTCTGRCRAPADGHRPAARPLAQQRATASLPGFHTLKCEVLCSLARCYLKAGSTDAAAKTCRAAIDVCRAGAASSERCAPRAPPPP
jgi:tetratricopeptide (TPR) repeat protein